MSIFFGSIFVIIGVLGILEGIAPSEHPYYQPPAPLSFRRLVHSLIGLGLFFLGASIARGGK